jgi:nucleoid-associated protein YgaU
MVFLGSDNSHAVIGRPTGHSGVATTHAVTAGETLRDIAQQHLGSASAYMKIFEVNQDQLTDADEITPGQVLRLP